MYKIEFAKRATKYLKSIDSKEAVKLIKKINELALNPYTNNLDIKKLQAVIGAYRLRIGEYRIIYEIQNDKLLISVVNIGTRDKIYG